MTTLPAGSEITVKDRAILAPAFNEIADARLLIKDCILISPAYLQQRDEMELELLRIIEELKIKKDVP